MEGLPAILRNSCEKFSSNFEPGNGVLTWVASPGRVNLIGEHTDYHRGLVLPAAIDRYVCVIGRRREDSQINILSDTYNELWRFSTSDLVSAQNPSTKRLIGSISMLLEKVVNPCGMDVLMTADLPIGSGLSSSAASMVALGILTAKFNDLKLDSISFARTLQEAEHRFAGTKCGIMDQLAILLALKGNALLIDCMNLEMSYVPLPATTRIIIVDSGVQHDLATSEYNRRQEECNEVLQYFHKSVMAIDSLRDLSFSDLKLAEKELTQINVKRCKHVLSENTRVLAAREALVCGAAEVLAGLFKDSHISLKDDYQVSCYELDTLVEIAERFSPLVASRMTGGGFGGCTVNLIKEVDVPAFSEFIVKEYKRITGKECRVICANAVDGVIWGQYQGPRLPMSYNRCFSLQ
ncbi:galactokinase [Candidatus Riflebacteria bacterium]